ncbi:hypothetical protein HK098_004255 [Nowakowskiella sp. JEL0407]|nr:hypothetical protein HK098_004255 [Nowakowskiella sp. JEL0407]
MFSENNSFHSPHQLNISLSSHHSIPSPIKSSNSILNEKYPDTMGLVSSPTTATEPQFSTPFRKKNSFDLDSPAHSPEILQSENTKALEDSVKKLQDLLAERDKEVAVAAKIGNDLLETISSLQKRISELEGKISIELPRSQSSSQMQSIETDFVSFTSSLRGFVGQISNSSSPSSASSESPDQTPKTSKKGLRRREGDISARKNNDHLTIKKPDITPRQRNYPLQKTPTSSRPAPPSLTPTSDRSVNSQYEFKPSISPLKKRPSKSFMERLHQSRLQGDRLPQSPADNDLFASGINTANGSAPNLGIDQEIAEALVVQVRALQQSLEVTQADKTELQETVGKLEKTIESLESKNQRLKTSEGKLEEKIWSLEVTISSQQEKASDLESQLKRSHFELNSLKKQCQKYSEQLEALKVMDEQETDELQTKHELLVGSLRRELANLQRENKALLKQLEETFEGEDPDLSKSFSHNASFDVNFMDANELSRELGERSLIAEDIFAANLSLENAKEVTNALKDEITRLEMEKAELTRLLSEAQETIERLMNGDTGYGFVSMERISSVTGRSLRGTLERNGDHPSLLKELSFFNDTMDIGGRLSLDRSRNVIQEEPEKAESIINMDSILSGLEPIEPISHTEEVLKSHDDDETSIPSLPRSIRKTLEIPGKSMNITFDEFNSSFVDSIIDPEDLVSRDVNIDILEETETTPAVPAPANEAPARSKEEYGEVRILKSSSYRSEPLSVEDGAMKSSASNVSDPISFATTAALPPRPLSFTKKDSNEKMQHPAQLLSDLAILQPESQQKEGEIQDLRRKSIQIRVLSGTHGFEKDEKFLIPQVPVQALAATMIGGWFHKYNRYDKNPQMRFVWVNPYTRTLYWSPVQPSQSRHKTRQIRTAYIESMAYPQPPQTKNVPPTAENHITIITPDRTVKLVPLSWNDHQQWIEGLALLLHRCTSNTPVHEQFKLVDTGESTHLSPDTDIADSMYGSMPRRRNTENSILEFEFSEANIPKRTRSRTFTDTAVQVANALKPRVPKLHSQPSIGTMQREKGTITRRLSMLFKRTDLEDETEEREKSIRRSQSLSVLSEER